MLVEGHLVEWLILAKCVTLLKYCVNKINKINQNVTNTMTKRASRNFPGPLSLPIN